jgi:thioredoxin reductase (NADPH)
MSDYLIKQFEATSNIEVRPGARVVDARGEARLQALLLEDLRTGRQEEVDAVAVFVLIGAKPPDWLRNVVELDDHEFVLTGRDIPQHAWPLQRAPLPFETSMPGVLAAGDVRHGSVKRVAGAVGEGSVAVG